MLIIKSDGLCLKHFNDQVVVFDPNSGQTHCLDISACEIFNQISTKKPKSLLKLKQYFIDSCQEHEKAMLDNYIQDMINSFLQLKLVRVFQYKKS